MLSEQKMSVKLLMIGAVLLIAAVKGESLAEPSFQLCNRNFVFFTVVHHILLFGHAMSKGLLCGPIVSIRLFRKALKFVLGFS